MLSLWPYGKLSVDGLSGANGIPRAGRGRGPGGLIRILANHVGGGGKLLLAVDDQGTVVAIISLPEIGYSVLGLKTFVRFDILLFARA